MTHATTTCRRATTSSQGADTQPVSHQPADNTRHQHQARSSRPQQVSNDDQRERGSATVLLPTSKEHLGTRTRYGSRIPELSKTPFQSGLTIESSQLEFRKSRNFFRVTPEQLYKILRKVISRSCRPDVCSIEQLT